MERMSTICVALLRFLSPLCSVCGKCGAIVLGALPMLAMRCYPPVMPRDAEAGEMTEFGREVWAVIQRRGRYSQAAIGRRIEEKTGWKPSRQAINHWLHGTRDVHRDFVPALVGAFDLTEEEERTLKDLYFYGQGDGFAERVRRSEGSSVPEEPGLSEENELKLDAKRREWDVRDEAKRREGDPEGAGGGEEL